MQATNQPTPHPENKTKIPSSAIGHLTHLTHFSGLTHVKLLIKLTRSSDLTRLLFASLFGALDSLDSTHSAPWALLIHCHLTHLTDLPHLVRLTFLPRLTHLALSVGSHDLLN